MSDEYYIRIRGTVKGPLSRDQIVTQIRRKRLGRHHELSLDAVHWKKAGDMPELFKPLVPTGSNLDFDVDESTADSSTEPEVKHAASGRSEADDPKATPVQAEWFYAQNGKQSGPVSETDIRRMVSMGTLAASDLIWSEGFEKWTPAGETSGFAAAFVQPPVRPQQETDFIRDDPQTGFWEVFMGTSRGAALSAKSQQKFPNLTRYLRLTESALRVLFVLFLLCGFAAWLQFVEVAFSAQQWFTFSAGLVAGPLGVLITWLLFTSALAGLELIRVVIHIEDNSANR